MKSWFEAVQAAFGRMTPRERRLFVALIASITMVVVGGAYLAVESVVGSLEDEVEHYRTTLAQVRKLLPEYRRANAERMAVEDAIRSFQATSIRVAANEILKKMELVDDVRGATGSQMSDIVSFEGKTTTTPVNTAPRKKGKRTKSKKKPVSGLVMVEQKLEFRDVPWENLKEFLDVIQKGKELLFVTRLEIARKFNDMKHVRAEVTIASFKFSEGEGGAAGKATAR